ncbi:protein translocase subunit SecF [Candidatus Giovannonibacteria bacterium]|nr:protein translocase subunit SecF [Candidatus Giovannonibacteria bacterium]
MTIIGSRKISYAVSGALIALSLVSLALWGLKLGIDFTGGSLIEAEFAAERPANEDIILALKSKGLENIVAQPTGEKGVILKLKDLNENEHQEVLSGLKSLGDVTEKRFSSIGPTIGSELRKRSMWSVALVILMIVIYLSWAFRKVSRPMASWKYGIAAIVALIHDITIPMGLFSVLGHFYGIEVDTLFVTALLTILGFSVHDTIVVFDRIRETLNRSGAGSADFENVVEKSIRSTILRSINTSFTVVLVLAFLFFLGGESVKYFTLAMLVGVFFGTYSSIFVASALLVSWFNFERKPARAA